MIGPLENGIDHRAPGRRRPARALAAAAACLLALAGCGNNDDSPNVILPLIAAATVTPDPGGDPQIYMEKVSETGDLVVVNVRLRAGMSIQFLEFNVEFDFDPTVVTVGSIGYAGGLLCSCDGSDTSCMSPVTPICLPDSNLADGNFTLSIAASTGSGSPLFDTAGTSDVILVTLGFRAAGETPGTTIFFPPGTSVPDHGCEILATPGGMLTDLGIPCALGLDFMAQR